MKRLALIPLLSALCSTPLTLSAAQPVERQRALFLETLSAAQKGDQQLVEVGLKKLKDYPLLPYIQFEQISSQLRSLQPGAVLAFSQRYPDTPLEGRLRWAMTTELGRRGDWAGFSQLYATLNSPNTEQQCYHGRALLAQQKRAEGLALAAQLWSQGQSQPAVCDPLFETWIRAGGLTDAIALNRSLAALQAGNPALATYASGKIKGEAGKAQAALAQRLYEKPSDLLRQPALVNPDNQQARQLLLLAVERLMRSDLDAAIELWIRDRTRLGMPTVEQADTSTRLALRKAKRFESDSEATLARLDPEQRLDEVTEWRARLALTRRDWLEVERLITRLDDSKRYSDRWRYWYAIARQHQGQPIGDALTAMSQERSFYSFLAAELSGHTFALNDEPARFERKTLDSLAAQPAFRRIAELYALNKLYEARSEWNFTLRSLNAEQQHQAAHLVRQWGWHNQAIRGAIQSDRWNDLALRFPDPYPELFRNAARKQGIEPTWATAIARQESAFWIEAKSHAGARGLMQLMPATATQTAKRHALPLNGIESLYRPEINVPLGSAYLAEMYQRFNNSRVFASAAYNAGPHRVSRWLEQRGKLPLDIWIETIPFDETRNYVQNVLAFAVIYDRMNNRPTRLLSDQERLRLAYHEAPTARQEAL